MSPLSDETYVADLAAELRFPLIVVARNALGTIHQTLATLAAAEAFAFGHPVAGIVLNQSAPRPTTQAWPTTAASWSCAACRRYWRTYGTARRRSTTRSIG